MDRVGVLQFGCAICMNIELCWKWKILKSCVTILMTTNMGDVETEEREGCEFVEV